mmetsp:Transcript_6827/g.16640  ORF Transcript_6827/g.16640 Transcript_6827/m.16640 type:complete len:466 (+) Transcript_6827:232-1629(+)
MAFEQAASKSPCVLLLDDVDSLAPRRDAVESTDADRRLVTLLLSLMDTARYGESFLPDYESDLSKGEIFVIATTSRINAVDKALRRAGRLDYEIEVPVPHADQRFAILQSFVSPTRSTGRCDISDADLRSIANVAHGFVGADLGALWRSAVCHAIDDAGVAGAIVTTEDLLAALKTVRPSALREMVVEVPKTFWNEIGGQGKIKERLREAVEWPIGPMSSVMAKLGIKPPRGILMFGPPGCSKTMMAKAVATESGLNFISIKGPELLSKYVGESEKAVRSAFKRAQACAPSVIFFDEIDALASSRGRASSGAEDRVLAQLLTELDGVEGIDDRVVVLAATNRPDLIDPSLLRPGRMDRLVYVGLPTEDERKEILGIHLRDVPTSESKNEVAEFLSSRTDGLSGAELAGLVRESALLAMEEDVENAEEVCLRHFELALSRVTPKTSPEMLKFYKNYTNSAKGVMIV